MDNPLATFCTGRTLQSRVECCTWSDPFEDNTPLCQGRAFNRVLDETQNSGYR